MQSSALLMTYHRAEGVIAFGMPSAKRTSPLSASPEPLLHMISRWIYGGEECTTFDNFPYDLPLGGMKRPDLMLMRQVELSYGWREWSEGTHLIVVDATLAIMVMKKHSQKYQYDTRDTYKVLTVCQWPIQNKGFASNSYRHYTWLQTILRVFWSNGNNS